MGRTCHNYLIGLMQHSVMNQKPHQHRKTLHFKIWYSLHQQERSGEGITHDTQNALLADMAGACATELLYRIQIVCGKPQFTSSILNL